MATEKEILVKRAMEAAARADKEAHSARRMSQITDWLYDKSENKFWDIAENKIHPDAAMDASIPHEFWPLKKAQPDVQEDGEPGKRGRGRPTGKLIKPSVYLRRVEVNDGLQFIDSNGWMPGEPMIIENKFINNTSGEVTRIPGARLYNRYRPSPRCESVAVNGAQPFLRHLNKVHSAQDVKVILDVCAHMFQKPQEKCNLILAIAGEQGVGKDTYLYSVTLGMTHNARTINPDIFCGDHQSHLESVMLLINEIKAMRDEHSATSMYGRLKATAAPPVYLPMNQKYIAIRYVKNVLRIFLTMNDANDLYIPEGDRRIYLAKSELKKGWHLADDPDYFDDYYAWLGDADTIGPCGWKEISAYLMQRDISGFNPKVEAEQTDALLNVIGSWSATDDAVSYAIEKLSIEEGTPPVRVQPDVIFGAELVSAAGGFDHKQEIDTLVRFPRKLIHRMKQAGYQFVACPPDRMSDGGWRFNGPDKRLYRSKTVFVHKDIAAAARPGLIIAHGETLVGAKPRPASKPPLHAG